MSQSNSSIQAYLNQQLHQIQIQREEASAKKSLSHFDKIQQRLKKLQTKLMKLKDDSPRVQELPTRIELNQEETVEDRIQISTKKKHTKQIKESNNRKSEDTRKKLKFQVEVTPNKNTLKQKTKSEAIFSNQFINSNRNFISSNKKIKKENERALLSQTCQMVSSNRKSSSNKIIPYPIESSGKKLFKMNSSKHIAHHSSYVKDSSFNHVKYLEKEIESCWKANNQLKNRISELKGYETEYWRMKQIFQKCEKLRRKNINSKQ